MLVYCGDIIFYISSKMIIENTIHRNLVEENQNNTTFGRSLHSKMSVINIFNDILDLLIYSCKLISTVQSDDMSRIAFFWSYFLTRVKSLMIYQIMEKI